MDKILAFQSMAGETETHDGARVSTVSVIPPCPGWPSAVTFGNCYRSFASEMAAEVCFGHLFVLPDRSPQHRRLSNPRAKATDMT